MADRIGLSRRHFQDHRVPHYDLCLSKRALAVTAGACQLSAREAARRRYKARLLSR